MDKEIQSTKQQSLKELARIERGQKNLLTMIKHPPTEEHYRTGLQKAINLILRDRREEIYHQEQLEIGHLKCHHGAAQTILFLTKQLDNFKAALG